MLAAHDPGRLDDPSRRVPADAQRPPRHNVLEGHEGRRREASSKWQQHLRERGCQKGRAHCTPIVDRKKASRALSDLNSAAQVGHSQPTRTRSFPLEADRTLNSRRYQIQAQLPETSLAFLASKACHT
jgi:hypothetical protein